MVSGNATGVDVDAKLRVLVGVSIALLATVAQAQQKGADKKKRVEETVPKFFHIPSAEEDGVMSADCTGTPPYREIDCSFEQLTLSGPPKTPASEKEAALQALWKGMEEPGAAAELRKMCDGMRSREVVGGPRALAAAAPDVETVRKACACPDPELPKCMGKWLATSTTIKDQTCKVWTNTFAFRLKRVGSQRMWRYNGESGLCSVSLVITIEEVKPYLWTFTQQKLPGEKSPLCPEKPSSASYRWDALDTFDLTGCKLLKFGY